MGKDTKEKFQGDKWIVYLNEDARERRDEILDHLVQHYDGPAQFVREKLDHENALSIEERIERAEQDVKEQKRKLEELKERKRRSDERDKLRDKKELLKQKQSKLRDFVSQEGISREEAEEKVLQEMRKRSRFDGYSDDELCEMRAFQKKVDELVVDRDDVEELVEDVKRLQEEVAELNGGRESWFMDLDQNLMEVES